MIFQRAKTLFFAALIYSCFVVAPNSSAIAFDKKHQLFTAELGKYVHAGRVDYTNWKKSVDPLEAYLKSLADISSEEYEALSMPDKKALWLNGYNAFTIKVVLDHYPIKGDISYYPSDSLRQIPDVWEAFHFKVAGRTVNLEDLEHCIIRREFHDPRMHFAVVCAASGAAPLAGSAFTGDDLESVLEKAKDTFLSDSKNIRVDADKKVIAVSRVFSWFPLDFAPPNFFKGLTVPPSDDQVVLAYLSRSGPPQLVARLTHEADLKSMKIEYMDFDWSLNDLKESSNSRNSDK